MIPFVKELKLTVRLTEKEEKILNLLQIMEAKQAAENMDITVDTLHVYLHRIRKKYKAARSFVNKIDSWKSTKPALRKYLRTQEMV